jgi:hypothetical protein
MIAEVYRSAGFELSQISGMGWVKHAFERKTPPNSLVSGFDCTRSHILPVSYPVKECPGGRNPYRGHTGSYLQIGKAMAKAMIELRQQ